MKATPRSRHSSSNSLLTSKGSLRACGVGTRAWCASGCRGHQRACCPGGGRAAPARCGRQGASDACHWHLHSCHPPTNLQDRGLGARKRQQVIHLVPVEVRNAWVGMPKGGCMCESRATRCPQAGACLPDTLLAPLSAQMAFPHPPLLTNCPDPAGLVHLLKHLPRVLPGALGGAKRARCKHVGRPGRTHAVPTHARTARGPHTPPSARRCAHRRVAAIGDRLDAPGVVHQPQLRGARRDKGKGAGRGRQRGGGGWLAAGWTGHSAAGLPAARLRPGPRVPPHSQLTSR